MRNWPKTVSGSSFRGVAFELDRQDVDDVGRYVAHHPFAKAEDHATEDMGRKANKFKLTAYLTGDNADARMSALVAACSTPGTGMLILPMWPGVTVRCSNCSTSVEKTKQGFVAVALEFIEAGASSGGFPAIALGDRIAETLLGGMPMIISGAIATFDAFSNSPIGAPPDATP